MRKSIMSKPKKAPKPQEKADWKYNYIEAIRDECDWLWSAGCKKDGNYLPKAKNNIEKLAREYISQIRQEERERIIKEIEEWAEKRIK